MSSFDSEAVYRRKLSNRLQPAPDNSHLFDWMRAVTAAVRDIGRPENNLITIGLDQSLYPESYRFGEARDRGKADVYDAVGRFRPGNQRRLAEVPERVVENSSGISGPFRERPESSQLRSIGIQSNDKWDPTNVGGGAALLGRRLLNEAPLLGEVAADGNGTSPADAEVEPSQLDAGTSDGSTPQRKHEVNSPNSGLDIPEFLRRQGKEQSPPKEAEIEAKRSSNEELDDPNVRRLIRLPSPQFSNEAPNGLNALGGEGRTSARATQLEPTGEATGGTTFSQWLEKQKQPLQNDASGGNGNGEGGGGGGGGGWGGDGKKRYDADCKKTRDEARQICIDGFVEGFVGDRFRRWKSNYATGPFKKRRYDISIIDDCKRGLISEACGGNEIEQPPPRKVKRYNVRPRRKKKKR